MSGRWIHVIAYINSSSLFITKQFFSIWIYHILSIFLLMNTWAISTLGQLWKRCSEHSCTHFFCRHMFSFFLSKFLELKSLGHKIFIFLVSLEKKPKNCQMFVKEWMTRCILTNSVCEFQWLSIDWVALIPKIHLPRFCSGGKGEE